MNGQTQILGPLTAAWLGVPDQSKYTLPVALAQFNSQLIVPFNYILAMSVVSMLPVIIIFLFLQRQIVTGIANTGLK